MVEKAQIHFTLRRNPFWPTATDPRQRFDKPLEVSPWAGTVEAIIYLEDPTWEGLGWPAILKVTIEGAKV